MKPLFHPHLINGALGDPGLYIEFKFARRALLFDLGDLHCLPPRKILRTTHVFISHTHMDHFIGFDHLLRIFLGRDKEIHLFGPHLFLNHLQSKLSAYSWNLVQDYPNALMLKATEVRPDHQVTARFLSTRRFCREDMGQPQPFHEVLHEEEAFRVRTTFLNHKIPCLAFAFEEKKHINIMKPALVEMKIPKGPWLRQLKEALWKEHRDDAPFRVWWKGKEGIEERWIPLGELKRRLVKITPGQKIGYVVDTIYNGETRKQIECLVQGSDILFIEAAFLDEDAPRAREKYHLTAKQAGFLARGGGVKQIIPFHFSPKYLSEPEKLKKEAEESFAGDPS